MPQGALYAKNGPASYELRGHGHRKVWLPVTEKAYTDEISPERQELWGRISQLWIGNVEFRRMSVRLDLMEDELQGEIEAMRRNGYELDPKVRGDSTRPKPATKAQVERATSTWFRHLTYWRKAGYTEGYAYVIRAGEDGPVKIGKAMDPESRLSEHQTSAWLRLRLLHIMPGYGDTEAALHERVKDSRIMGEWFSGPEVEELLETLDEMNEVVIRHHRETGEIIVPTRTQKKRTPRKGIPSGAYFGHGLQSRWRTSDNQERPVTVRRVDPETLKRNT